MKYLHKFLSAIILLFSALGIVSCGDPTITLDSSTYEPKIVVEGYLYPGVPIRNIRITRNFPLNQSIDTATFIIADAVVKINGVLLQFDPGALSYKTDALQIEKGKTYTLEVSARVAGQLLQTTASTTVPVSGFTIANKHLGTFTYGSDINLRFLPLSETGFYAFSVRPDSASVYNFIYDNDFRSDIQPIDVQKDLNQYQFQMSFSENLHPSATDTLTHPIKDFDTWFYSSYKVIVYAGDQNLKDFVLTAPSVKEIDGNFHEPRMSLSGDGIGVFASAIRDTAYFTLTK
jgi:hypothetical protein